MKYDGPRLARWIIDQFWWDRISNEDRRLVRHWSEGQNPSEKTVDSFCCRINFIHLLEIPESCQLVKLPKDLVQIVKRDRREGYRGDEIARMLELSAGLIDRAERQAA